jgi:predicted transcriptional regulator
MRFDTLVYLRDHPKVIGSAHHLLLMLALYGHQDTDVAWPSLATLAYALGVQRCQVQRLLKRLVEVGAVRITRGGGRCANMYEVLVPPDFSTPAASRIRGMKSDVSSRIPQP